MLTLALLQGDCSIWDLQIQWEVLFSYRSENKGGLMMSILDFRMLPFFYIFCRIGLSLVFSDKWASIVIILDVKMNSLFLEKIINLQIDASYMKCCGSTLVHDCNDGMPNHLGDGIWKGIDDKIQCGIMRCFNFDMPTSQVLHSIFYFSFHLITLFQIVKCIFQFSQCHRLMCYFAISNMQCDKCDIVMAIL